MARADPLDEAVGVKLRRVLCSLGVHEWSYVGERTERLRFGIVGFNRVCRACGKRAWWV